MLPARWSIVAALLGIVGASTDTTFCYTHLTSKSVSYSTAWSEHWTPCTSVSTKTINGSAKPVIVTRTSTIYVTETKSASSNGQTATQTITKSSTVLTTSFVTLETISTTVVTGTSTSTVASSSGFVPIQDSLSGAFYAGFSPNEGTNPIPRDAQDAAAQYPKAVTCLRWTRSSKCSTVLTTITSQPPASTSKSTKTITSSITSTLPASAKTTITQTSSVNITSTLISSTTLTSTITLTTWTSTTVYAACAPSNLADIYQFPNSTLLGFADGHGNYSSLIHVSGASSAYTCCVASLFQPNAAAYGWRIDQSPGQCLVPVADASTSGQSSVQLDASVGDGNWVFGNGACGAWRTAAFSGSQECGTGGFCSG